MQSPSYLVSQSVSSRFVSVSLLPLSLPLCPACPLVFASPATTPFPYLPPAPGFSPHPPIHLIRISAPGFFPQSLQRLHRYAIKSAGRPDYSRVVPQLLPHSISLGTSSRSKSRSLSRLRIVAFQFVHWSSCSEKAIRSADETVEEEGFYLEIVAE